MRFTRQLDEGVGLMMEGVFQGVFDVFEWIDTTVLRKCLVGTLVGIWLFAQVLSLYDLSIRSDIARADYDAFKQHVALHSHD